MIPFSGNTSGFGASVCHTLPGKDQTMGEYEPEDSRDVTLTKSNTPIEPERTGPEESRTRKPAEKDEAKDGKIVGRAVEDKRSRP